MRKTDTSGEKSSGRREQHCHAETLPPKRCRGRDAGKVDARGGSKAKVKALSSQAWQTQPGRQASLLRALAAVPAQPERGGRVTGALGRADVLLPADVRTGLAGSPRDCCGHLISSNPRTNLFLPMSNLPAPPPITPPVPHPMRFHAQKDLARLHHPLPPQVPGEGTGLSRGDTTPARWGREENLPGTGRRRSRSPTGSSC